MERYFSGDDTDNIIAPSITDEQFNFNSNAQGPPGGFIFWMRGAVIRWRYINYFDAKLIFMSRIVLEKGFKAGEIWKLLDFSGFIFKS